MTSPAVPFSVPLSEQILSSDAGLTYVTAKRRVHGVARVDDDRLVLQLAESRAVVQLTEMGVTQRMESDPVAERAIPLALVGDARLRRHWLWWQLVLTAADLRAFEGLPGAEGVELRLRVDRRHRALAEELVGTLQLALAELAVQRAEGRRLAR